MLPLHTSSPKGKMHRHAYSNGQAGYPSLGGNGTFSIEPHKYVKPPPCTVLVCRHILRLFFPVMAPDRSMLITTVAADSSRDHSLPYGAGDS
jgi:hypothetical protein